jgi:hypothetical protein
MHETVDFAVKTAISKWARFGPNSTQRMDQQILSALREEILGHDLQEILQSLPSDLADASRNNIRQFPSLKGIGYWYSGNASDSRPFPIPVRTKVSESFPDPTRLVYPTWRIQDREKIARYLRSGWTYQQWRGLSYCRFRCKIASAEMGSRCVTDGQWVWPEGLHHYIEHHCVRLPEEFVESMQRSGWQVPSGKSEPNWQTSSIPDYSFWIAWAKAAGAIRSEETPT